MKDGREGFWGDRFSRIFGFCKIGNLFLGWIWDFGFWILDFGFWILDFGFLILDFENMSRKYMSRKLPKSNIVEIVCPSSIVFLWKVLVFFSKNKNKAFIQKLQNTKNKFKKKDGQNFFNIVIFFFRKIIFVVI